MIVALGNTCVNAHQLRVHHDMTLKKFFLITHPPTVYYSTTEVISSARGPRAKSIK